MWYRNDESGSQRIRLVDLKKEPESPPSIRTSSPVLIENGLKGVQAERLPMIDCNRPISNKALPPKKAFCGTERHIN